MYLRIKKPWWASNTSFTPSCNVDKLAPSVSIDDTTMKWEEYLSPIREGGTMYTNVYMYTNDLLKHQGSGIKIMACFLNSLSSSSPYLDPEHLDLSFLRSVIKEESALSLTIGI